MEHGSLFFQAFVYLLAAVISVPISKKIGLGSVLGYLLAGVVIGPYVLGFVGQDLDEVMHFSEFGVVMMLFLVGLELRPNLLWKLRVPILGVGGMQVLLTTLVFMLISMYFGFVWQHALVIGMILALSSTAIVLQTLNEKGWMKTSAGKSSFSVLLFQDIAVIPMLALLPVLTVSKLSDDSVQHGLLASLPGWAQALVVIGIVLSIIVIGHYLLRPIFRIIGELRMREIFTAAALLLVIGIALAMQSVGLSPALGTFVAGVVLAESEYRHELETNIEPFKGLLLGLFFISVGASINFPLLFDKPWLILSIVAGLLLVKFLILFIIATVSKMSIRDKWLFSFALAQAGEFGFVLLNFAGQLNILPNDVISILLVCVALSMLVTPIMMIFYEKAVEPRFTISNISKADDEIDEHESDAIIIGFGRFGTTIGRLLLAQGYKITVLDYDSNQIEMVRKFGLKVFYGDATRPDLLQSAGADNAKVLIIALSDKDKIDMIIDHVKHAHPNLKILVRAKDRNHAYDLMKKGIELQNIYRDCFGSSISLGEQALKSLGQNPYQAYRISRLFADYDTKQLSELFEISDEASYVSESIKHHQRISDLLQTDKQYTSDYIDHAWEE